MLFNLIFVNKESQCNTNTVVVESTYLHCKEVYEYVLLVKSNEWSIINTAF